MTRINEHMVLQQIDSDPPRYVLMNDRDGTELVFDHATASRMLAALVYFLRDDTSVVLYDVRPGASYQPGRSWQPEPDDTPMTPDEVAWVRAQRTDPEAEQ